MADTYSVTFHYDKRGRGTLELRHFDAVVCTEECRTGSVDVTGALVNALRPGRWYLCDDPMDTAEEAMVVNGVGWKMRLYEPDWYDRDVYHTTGYLIHPDGGRGGTLGCVGTQGPALTLREALRNARRLTDKGVLPLDVWKEEED